MIVGEASPPLNYMDLHHVQSIQRAIANISSVQAMQYEILRTPNAPTHDLPAQELPCANQLPVILRRNGLCSCHRLHLFWRLIRHGQVQYRDHGL